MWQLDNKRPSSSFHNQDLSGLFMLPAKTLYLSFHQLSARVLVLMGHVQNQILVHVMQASMEQYVTEVSNTRGNPA